MPILYFITFNSVFAKFTLFFVIILIKIITLITFDLCCLSKDFVVLIIVFFIILINCTLLFFYKVLQYQFPASLLWLFFPEMNVHKYLKLLLFHFFLILLNYKLPLILL